MTETDRSLQENVLAELEWEPSIDAAHIGVTVQDGVVALSGHVSSYAEKIAAERAVRRVKGVKAIAQEVDVRLPDDKTVTDEDIAARAVRALEWNVSIPHDRLTVRVEKGFVTLLGELDWQFQKREALSTLRILPGVRNVIDNVTIRPSLRPAEIRHKIEEAFRRSADLDASSIAVSAEGGRVTLTGQVHSHHERALAEEAAWSAPGVTAVEDRITLTP